MSREIKFRALTLEGELIYFDFHDSFMSGDSEIFYVRVPAPAAVDNIPCQIGTEQQFTGLLDKNGKEIYEGDIVKYVDDDGSIMIGEVKELRYQWGLDNDEQFSAFCHQIQTSRTDFHEIIGNIYSNPELVKP